MLQEKGEEKVKSSLVTSREMISSRVSRLRSVRRSRRVRVCYFVLFTTVNIST